MRSLYINNIIFNIKPIHPFIDSSAYWHIVREYTGIDTIHVITSMRRYTDTDWIIMCGGISMKTYMEEANCGGYIP